MSKPQWTVDMVVTRNISVTVEAATEDEARAKAGEWDIVGEEMENDTIDYRITAVRKDA